jgi:hypothetical protein
MKIIKTDYGTIKAEFFDLVGAQCSIEQSITGCDHTILFGVEKTCNIDTRMTLNWKTATQIIEILKEFEQTGHILRGNKP